MKKIIILAIVVLFGGCTELEQLATGPNIGEGLRQALNLGVDNQVKLLTATDGFYKNELVKIGLPEELKLVESKLREIGLGNLADEGLIALNRTAEDAVKTATPIFVTAVKEITFADATNILMGEESAATTYLQGKTQEPLYGSFSPVIKTSFEKVGADKIWENLINQYNKGIIIWNSLHKDEDKHKEVNPDMADYVTKKALEGVFKMIAKEEIGIRSSAAMRTTDLLKEVFALQDNK